MGGLLSINQFQAVIQEFADTTQHIRELNQAAVNLIPDRRALNLKENFVP
jgi:hypothetical protein